jgi:hypothetical protein
VLINVVTISVRIRLRVEDTAIYVQKRFCVYWAIKGIAASANATPAPCTQEIRSRKRIKANTTVLTG